MNTVPLVSLDDAKLFQRVDTDDEDGILSMLVLAASNAVLDYLSLRASQSVAMDSFGDLYPDSNGVALGVEPVVQSATLLMFGYLYKNRDSDPDKAFERGYLPMPVTALLYQKRTPNIA